MSAVNFEERKIRTVIITLTNSCNLSCSYCYEEFKHSGSMSFDVAYEIISRELNKPGDFDLILLDFFGGEPFLQFKLITRIVASVKARVWKNDYLFHADTNGTLVHGEIREWLIANSDCFVCGLSYDGTKEMQNVNRSNSADMIDLDFFLKQYCNEGIKMTVSPETLSMFGEGVLYLHSKGAEVSCNLAYGVDWSAGLLEETLENELTKLIDFYVEHPEITPCSMLNMEIDAVAFGTEKMFRYCGCGIEMVAYDIDGKPYPCHLFMPLSAGVIKAAKVSELTFHEGEIPIEYIEEKCRGCVIKSVCPTCYGSNYITFGDINRHDDQYCKLTKIIIKARSYFKGRQWELGQLQLSNEDEKVLLRSIITIQDNL